MYQSFDTHYAFVSLTSISTLHLIIKIRNTLLDELVAGSTTLCSYCGKSKLHGTLLDELVTVVS